MEHGAIIGTGAGDARLLVRLAGGCAITTPRTRA
jgi:hypothetical protein